MPKITYEKEIEIEKRDIQDNSIEAIFANIKMIETREGEKYEATEKEPKGNLISLDLEITFDSNLYTLLRAHYDAQAFDKLREEKELCIDFSMFPEEIARLLNNSQSKFTKKSQKKESHEQIESTVYFVTTNETSGYLIFLDILSFKEVEIFKIDFAQVSDEESHQQAQEKFTAVKAELKKQSLMLRTLHKEIKSQCPFMLEILKKM